MSFVRKAFGTLALLSAFTAVPVFAQLDEGGAAFTTSFPFYVGNQKMPAGAYKVTEATFDSDMLLIKSADGQHVAYVQSIPTESTTPASASVISFNEYGDTDFMNTITLSGELSGRELLPSKTEKATARMGNEHAANKEVPVQSAIAGS